MSTDFLFSIQNSKYETSTRWIFYYAYTNVQRHVLRNGYYPNIPYTRFGASAYPTICFMASRTRKCPTAIYATN